MSDDGKAISFEPTGDIVVHIDGHARTLRYPKYGVYLQIKRAWLKLTGLDRERLELSNKLSQAGNTDPYESIGRLDELTDELNAGKADIWRLAFEHLSDEPLPEGFEDWPTWMLTDETLVNDTLGHWRAVPLVHTK